MVCNERGVALVSVVLMLTVLLILAHIFVEKVWQSTRQSAGAAGREKVYWAAQAGVELAREQLAKSYCSSAGWQSFLTADEPRAYPAEPVWSNEVNGSPVEIYLRDNPDGDNDVTIDNDLKIYVLARARGQQGAEAMVESLCGFERSSAGVGTQSGSFLPVTGNQLSELPVSNYDIAD